MEIDELKALIQEILKSDIREFELEQSGTRIRLLRGLREAESTSRTAFEVQAAVPVPVQNGGSAVDAIISSQAAASVEDNGLHYITSPIVGTFYRAPSPSADPFVRSGSFVEEGATLCIVEAMKLMNEIPADIAGEVVKICVENGQPVEYGQRLFGVRPLR
jgi:acetyl-CoA carboxylase biotin carboxyl carrier protein